MDRTIHNLCLLICDHVTGPTGPTFVEIFGDVRSAIRIKKCILPSLQIAMVQANSTKSCSGLNQSTNHCACALVFFKILSAQVAFFTMCCDQANRCGIHSSLNFSNHVDSGFYCVLLVRTAVLLQAVDCLLPVQLSGLFDHQAKLLNLLHLIVFFWQAGHDLRQRF